MVVPPPDKRLIGLVLGVVGPAAVALALVPFRDRLPVADVALALVLPVLLAAKVGGRQSGIVAAVSAALSLNVLHTRPYLSLSIRSGQDALTVALLLVVGVVVGGLATGERTAMARAAASRGEVVRLHRVAEFVARGGHIDDVRLSVEAELTATLQLKDCSYLDVGAPESALPRFDRFGRVTSGTGRVLAEQEEVTLPPEGVELAVLGRGSEIGRFVCVPLQGVGVGLEQRLAAVTLADNLGSLLATH